MFQENQNIKLDLILTALTLLGALSIFDSNMLYTLQNDINQTKSAEHLWIWD